MRAAYIEQFGETDVLKVGELPMPEIGDHEVLVKLKTSALNHLDLWTRRGLGGAKVKFPLILGADGAGIVEKIGNEVTKVSVGDKVIVHPGISCGICEQCKTGIESLCKSYQILGEHRSGTNAEFVRVPAANIFSKPEKLSFEEAASIPLVFTTAWQMAVTHGRIKPGTKVLIHAAGSGVSSAAIQISAHLGAEIFATAGDSSKLSKAKELGAQHVINYKKQDFVSEIKNLTGRVDVILDHVGKDTWGKNFRCLRWGGKIITCGATTGYDVPVDLRHIFYRQVQIIGSTMGSKRDFPEILSLVEKDRLKGLVSQTFNLDEIAQAHELVARRKVFGKVVVNI